MIDLITSKRLEARETGDNTAVVAIVKIMRVRVLPYAGAVLGAVLVIGAVWEILKNRRRLSLSTS